MRPIIVGYYTRNTPYEKEAIVLKESIEACGYEHDIVAVDSLGSWQQNTQMKGTIIHDALIKHNRPILYLDVDAIMIHPPLILDDLDCDIAAVHYHGTTELLSGTVYFQPTAMPIVSRWIELNTTFPETLPDGRLAWDQRTLELAIKESGCSFTELPQEYTWITGMTQVRCPELNPVILHTRGALRFGNT